jgi:hypothetical protein
MNDNGPGEHRPASLIEGHLQRLVTNSLILYLLGNVAQRAWLLLNSDVGQLIRRLH